MLGLRIKELRLSHSLNQVELAQRFSVTMQTISNWENNNIQPFVDMLVKIADCFSVTTDYLLDRKNKISIHIDGLTTTEIAHIEQIIQGLKKH